jgi:phage FluMu gp28-like protein
MLAMTDGVLMAASTPWNKDSVFYRMCQSPDFSKHVVTADDVVKAGLIKQSFIDQMRRELPEEQFRREFLSEFVEDIDSWLGQSLIVKCIDSKLEFSDFHDARRGDFYIGLDFGKHQDFSVIIVIEKTERILRLIHVHRFPLKTEYASVIGYVKSLQDRWEMIRAVYADITGVGEYIVEDMLKCGIRSVTGVTFTLEKKEEMATILREKMRQGEQKIPYSPARTSIDVDLTAELNIEKSELLKTGHIRFVHPEGSHDDVFWATALAVYAAVKHPVLRGLVDFGNLGEKK